MKRIPLDIAVTNLVHAPWNPRAAITPSDVADLTESIRADGLIQRIAVISDPDAGNYVVIAGNRRLVACKAAGMDEVPCELLDVDEQTAKRMTLIENLQRCDVDPLMEADLIHGLTSDGMTIAAIAAETGRGEKWVWRRQQLVHLHPAWRQSVAAGRNISVDCLERVASYPAGVQEEARRTVDFDMVRGQIKWEHVERVFRRLVRDLDAAAFKREACVKCPNNSANAPTLFDLEPAKNGKRPKFGECLCAECFERKVDEHISGRIDWAKAHGHEVLTVKDQYSIPNSWSTSDKPTDTNTVLYIYRDYAGRKCMSWGQPQRQESEEDAEKAKIEKEQKRVKRQQGEVCAKVSTWIGGNAERFREIVSGSFSRAIKSSSSITQYHALALCQTFEAHDFNTGASAMEVAEEVVRGGSADLSSAEMDEFSDELGGSIQAGLTTYGREQFALRLLEVFPELREVVTPEEVELLGKKINY